MGDSSHAAIDCQLSCPKTGKRFASISAKIGGGARHWGTARGLLAGERATCTWIGRCRPCLPSLSCRLARRANAQEETVSKVTDEAESEHDSDAANSVPAEEEFDTASVVTVAGAHFTHDLYPSFLGPMLPLLIEKHGMSLAIAGSLATIPRWPGVAMPFLGYLADRYDARAFVIWGPTVTALAMSSLGLAPNYVTLIVLLLAAGFASSAFHPAAGAMATTASGTHWGRGTSYFMTGGELSRAVGPAFIVAVISAFSFEMAWVAAIPAFLISFVTYRRIAGRGAVVQRRVAPSGLRAAIRSNTRALLLLMGVITFRSLVIASFQIYYVTYLTESGRDLVYAGLALTVYEIGGVAGAFLGGQVSDRFGRRSVMALSQVVAGPVLFAALMLGGSPLALPALLVGGLMALSAGPVQLALAQGCCPATAARRPV